MWRTTTTTTTSKLGEHQDPPGDQQQTGQRHRRLVSSTSTQPEMRKSTSTRDKPMKLRRRSKAKTCENEGIASIARWKACTPERK